MTADFRVLAAVGALIISLSGADAAFASKPGGVLTVYNWDNPPSLSIHEEITNATLVPMMGVSNNLIMYKQDEPQNSRAKAAYEPPISQRLSRQRAKWSPPQGSPRRDEAKIINIQADGTTVPTAIFCQPCSCQPVQVLPGPDT